MNSIVEAKSIIPANAVEILPDSDRYKYRFKVRSSSSNSLYLISYDVGPGYWTCSCRGNIRHGSCKHLEAAGLKGRKFGRTVLPENKVSKVLTIAKV